MNGVSVSTDRLDYSTYSEERQFPQRCTYHSSPREPNFPRALSVAVRFERVGVGFVIAERLHAVRTARTENKVAERCRR